MLTCQGVSYRIAERTLLDQVTFRLAPGEAYGVVGAPGAGKTVLLAISCGLLTPTSGEVLLFDHQLAQLHPETAARSIGYMRHCIATVPSMTVAETLRFWSRLGGGRRVAHDRAQEVLERLDLHRFAQQTFARCPVGVQRALRLAVALLQRPALLVLDEPYRGIDAGRVPQLTEVLRDLRREGVAVLYATRELAQAQQVCDQVAMLQHGRLVPLVQPADEPAAR
ncbi:ABC transporter ATP-binding protein [Natronosporangium hydrolyticum]|uniref:ABC transporter ATP-binding protein n=1 Tax=Natronosporangium hydrolyticum TaxID=2811111 RepID=A0A895YPY0_9ACTN|nr:ABC transporter ATP-binding protein [Natronosporangium hydrolyticum]QSB16796.1 ABC transporter ATP-binding protein [Natronosporangium hydrolyticum]